MRRRVAVVSSAIGTGLAVGLVGCRPASQRAGPHFLGPTAPVLSDAPFPIALAGLRPDQRVRVRASSYLGNWAAEAVFAADASGRVDAASQAPLAGSYEGLDPMGLVWSMVRIANAAGAGDHEDVELAAEADGVVVARRLVRRRSAGPGVVTKTLTVSNAGGLAGMYFAPAQVSGPAVLVLSGSAGGIHARLAGLLASHGLPALALAYFNYPGLPTQVVEYPLEYFQRGMQWLRRQPAARGGRVQVVGLSRGGELALLLGATFPDEVAAVVAYVPSSVVWGALGELLRSAWSYRGVPVPYMNHPTIVRSPRTQVDVYLQQLAEEATAERAAIPVERIRGPVLALSGTDDQLWPSGVFCDRVVQRLRANNHPYPYAHLSYDGAGHTIGPPLVPTTTQTGSNPFSNSYAFGGQPGPNAAANADSWPRVLEFLGARIVQ